MHRLTLSACLVRERGAALVTALVFLAVITLISASSMRSSTIGVRMATNEESRAAAIQTAHALTETIVASPTSTPVIGGAGFSNCSAMEAGCDRYAVDVPEGYLADHVAAGDLSVRVARLTPPKKPPPRVLRSSVDKFSAASFQVVATYDRADEGLGRVRVVEGLLVLVPE